MVSLLKKISRRRNHTEEGGTLVMYIMLFPLVFSVFGLAIDTTVATYTQTNLQSNLDAATQSALSRAVNPTQTDTSTRPTITAADARTQIINVYDTNRIGTKEQPFVRCQTSVTKSDNVSYGAAKLVIPPSGCGWTQGNYTFANHNGQITVSMTIVESSSTIFLNLLGIKDFKYNITSDARITYERG